MESNSLNSFPLSAFISIIILRVRHGVACTNKPIPFQSWVSLPCMVISAHLPEWTGYIRSLFIYLLMDLWVVSGYWLLQKKCYKHLRACLCISSVESLSRVQLFATPWTAACQASLSITNSRSLHKLIYIESVMPSNHLTLCHPLFHLPSIFPSIRVFSKESVLHIRWLSIGISASASVLPINIQNRFPLGWAGWVSLQSKGLSKVFSNTTVQKHQFFGTQLSLWSNSHIHTWLL